MRVEYLTDQTYPPRDEKVSVQVLAAELSRPYIELAVITVGSANLCEKRLRQKFWTECVAWGLMLW